MHQLFLCNGVKAEAKNNLSFGFLSLPTPVLAGGRREEEEEEEEEVKR